DRASDGGAEGRLPVGASRAEARASGSEAPRTGSDPRLRGSAPEAAAAPAGRLQGALPRDGGVARHDPHAGPSAPRVPAQEGAAPPRAPRTEARRREQGPARTAHGDAGARGGAARVQP